MPAQLKHGPEVVLARILWANRNLGSDPTPWETYFGRGTKEIGARPTGLWPVFVAAEPPEPDNVITVYKTTPQLDARIMVTGEQQQKYGFTVRIGGKTKPVAERKTLDIAWDFERLFMDQQTTIEGQQYLIPSIPRVQVIELRQSPTAPHRWLFNINILANVLAYPIQG